MRVNCLSTQEELFETRFLKRVSQPIFLAAEEIPDKVDAPLILYGNWHPQGFSNGLRWLSNLFFHFPHPCILLSPFDLGAISDPLGLATSLHVQTINSNRLHVQPEANALHLTGKSELQVQTDYAFTGPTGKIWLATAETTHAAVIWVQPKNTSTPLILCGARLLSASGLSDNEDRLELLEGVLTWAANWKEMSDVTNGSPVEKQELDESIWHTVCILVAGTEVSTANEIISLARSLLGTEISLMDMTLANERLLDYGLAQFEGVDIKLNVSALETYTQRLGLWAYVRALRKDFERTQS